MLEAIFPISEYWSWTTFCLYFLVALCVTALCKKGARQVTFHKNSGKKKFKRNANIYYFLAYLLLVLLATLRNKEVGSDTLVYVNAFENAVTVNMRWKEFFSFQQWEPGFQFILVLCRKISSSYNVFFLIVYSIISAAYITFIRYFFDEKANYTFLQLFIFFYASNMSGMRSALGSVFLIISYIELHKRNYKKASVLTIFGMMFHYTMIYNLYIVVITWFMENTDLKKKRWIWGTGIAVVTIIAYCGIGFFNSIIAKTKYGFYTVDISELSFLGSIFYVIYVIMCLLFYRKLINTELEVGKVKTLLLITLELFVTYPVIYFTGAYRIPNYYALPRLRIWSEISTLIRIKISTWQGKVVFQIFLQIVVILYLLFRFTRSAEDGFFEYKLFFME